MHRLVGPLAVAAALLPAPLLAQEGPSFDCAYAGTATERAICASPALSRVELLMFGAYEDMEARIGPEAARRIADAQLLLRERCGADALCIEERLLVSMGLFMSDGGLFQEEGAPVTAALPPLGGPVPVEIAVVPIAEVERLVAASPIPRPDPLAGVSPQARPETPPDEPFDLAPLASDPAPMSPLALAFAALPDDRRRDVEERLAQAGFLAGPADGAWDGATEAALWGAAGAAGVAFDLRSAEGAAAALGFVGSDAFARGFLPAP